KKRSCIHVTQAAEWIELCSATEELAEKISGITPADLGSELGRVHPGLLAAGEIADPVDVHLFLSLPGELRKLAHAAKTVAPISGIAHQIRKPRHHSFGHKSRQATVTARQSCAGITNVSAKQFIAAVAGDGHGHMTAHEPGNDVFQNRRG